MEIDPRSFTEDPLNEPYLYHREWKKLEKAERGKLTGEAQDLISRTIFFEFEPKQRVTPFFEFTFTGIGGSSLEAPDDPVMIVGTATVDVPGGSEGYRVVAGEEGELSVIFRNEIRGENVPRVNGLFPGESSYVLDITDR